MGSKISAKVGQEIYILCNGIQIIRNYFLIKFTKISSFPAALIFDCNCSIFKGMYSIYLYLIFAICCFTTYNIHTF